MKILIVQNIECEGPGYLESFLQSEEIDYEIIRMYEGATLPDKFDCMITLGGPMNVYEEDLYPYLQDLDRAIRSFVENGGYYIGFCLGGQLLAKALGTRVVRNPEKEIGDFEINLTPEGIKDPLFKGFEDEFSVLEWHGDTFNIPEGGIKLAESKLCSNQAFRFKNAYGLQFHLETTQAMISEWTEVYRDELETEGIDPELILGETAKRADIYRRLANQLFRNFFDMVLGSGSF